MKKLILLALVGLYFVGCKQKTKSKPTQLTTTKTVVKSEPSFELLWETDTIFNTPESCFFDAEHNFIYVSNVNNAPRTKDNNGYISKLTLDGKIVEKEWITELSAPKGMGFYHEIIYVSDIDAIVEINAHTGFTIKRSTLKGALMLNDVAVDNKTGIVYVSDMDTGKVYSYKDGTFTLWKENFNGPNGLLVDGKNLLVASFKDSTLKAFDISSKEQKALISSNLGKADGIVKLNSGNYVVSDWSGEIHFIRDGKPTSLFNTKEDKKAQTADIGSIPNENIILVPTFFGNSVKAFKITE